jgi:small subunit ribosomal protein S16
MAVKIRLQRFGRKRRPFYHIVVANSRSPRDGKFIERLGSYNPNTNPATVDIDRDKAIDWLHKGAEPTDTVRALLSYTGVLYKKHLQRGVDKGAITQEEADTKLSVYLAKRESEIASKIAALANDTRTLAEKKLAAEVEKAEKIKATVLAKKSALAAEAAAANAESTEGESAEGGETSEEATTEETSAE